MAKRNEKTRIEFDFKNKHYVLEYTAASIKKMESEGFSITKLGDRIFTDTELLFYGAFLANHQGITRKQVREIYQELAKTAEDEEPVLDDDGNEVDGLTTILGEMLNEALEEMMNRGGNVSWKVTR
jgi:hypothetical protein